MTGKTKAWYASKTIWGIILGVLIVIADMFGVQPVRDLPRPLPEILEVIAFLIAAYGRIVARQQLK